MESRNESSLGKYRGAFAHLMLTCAVTGLVAAPAYAAVVTTTVHQARGYGAEVTVGSVVKLGQVALAEIPSCSTQQVGSMTASAASVNQPGLVSTGLVDSNASSTLTTSTGSSDVFGLNMLSGIITSTEIKAVSTSTLNSDGTFSFSTAGSTFGTLTILGQKIAANVAPNTVIDIPLVGSVTINEQLPYVSSDSASLTVNMIHLTISLGSMKGTQVIIASATSNIKKSKVPAVVGGYAEAPTLTSGSVSSGPLVYQLIPCFGTSGVVESDSIAAVNIPGVLNSGTVVVTGTGTVTSSGTTGEATTSTAGVNLLSGLLTATAINGVASASTTDGTNFEFTGGSTFVGLSVAGHPEITSSVKENTQIAIPGVGVLYLNRVLKSYSDEIIVRPIELVINTANTLGLPIGATVTIGAAEAQLHSDVVP